MTDDPMPPFVDVLVNDRGQSAGSIRAVDDGILEYLEERERTKPMVRDFGNATNKMYIAQTERYLSEAMQIATSLPLLNVPSSKITKAHVKAVQNVARAWRKVAETIEQQQSQEG